jgi:hypothetical protein
MQSSSMSITMVVVLLFFRALVYNGVKGGKAKVALDEMKSSSMSITLAMVVDSSSEKWVYIMK